MKRAWKLSFLTLNGVIKRKGFAKVLTTSGIVSCLRSIQLKLLGAQ